METEHLDYALEQEFAGHGATIHTLKVANPHFRNLLEQNHELWVQIKNIQNDVTPADDNIRRTLEKQRLKLLDEIGAMIRKAEG